MTQFKAKVTPTLSPQAQRLVDIYNNTYGSAGPGCNPDGLANVLEYVAYRLVDLNLLELSQKLRGEIS